MNVTTMPIEDLVKLFEYKSRDAVTEEDASLFERVANLLQTCTRMPDAPKVIVNLAGKPDPGPGAPDKQWIAHRAYVIAARVLKQNNIYQEETEA